MIGPVWIVASADTAPRWEDAFRAEGVDALALPWSRIEPAIEASALEARLARADFDVVLLTSPNAPRRVAEGRPADREAVCVGEATAAAAREAGFRVTLVGAGTGAELAKSLVAEREPARVLFLRGRDIRRAGIEILEAGGFRVAEEIVYEARPLADFAERVGAAPLPAGVAVGSPRGADALAGALVQTARETVRSRPVLAIGVPTADRLAELGFTAVSAPEVPGAAGLASLARSIVRGGTSP